MRSSTRGHETPPAPPTTEKPRRRKWFLVAAAIFSMLLVVGSGLSIAGIQYLDDSLPKVESGEGADPDTGGLPAVTPFCVRKACNYLILGSDSRAGLSAAEQASFGSPQSVRGRRSDTIIVVHIDPDAERAIVLHIPRDLRVKIPGHGTGKIASALEYNANTVVRTVERLTGLSINHYVQINLAGFEKIVDAVGGAPICVNRPMRDKPARLNLPRRGCYNLNGRQALAFVRARNLPGDVVPDFARIARQQQFMRALIGKLLSPTQVFNMRGLISATRNNLVIDDKLNLYDLQDLTRKLADISQRKVSFRIVPGVPKLIDEVSYVVPLQPATKRLFRRIREGKPLGKLGQSAPGGPVSPANVVVDIVDASSGGKAQKVAAYLQKSGFAVVGVEPAISTEGTNRIYYSKETAPELKVLVSYLPGMKIVRDPTAVAGADVTVVVGPRYRAIPSLR